MPITLRTATLDDLSLLEHWDEQPHVIASDPNDDWNWEIELQYEPAWREQLVAELDGRPIGFIQIIDAAQEETHYWGDVEENVFAIDIWIGEASDLSKGYGAEMMAVAIDRCFQNEKVHTILIDPLASNVRARKFYERIGFQFVEERQFNDDPCAVYRLERADWKK